MADEGCPICCNAFNRSLRRQVDCQYCGYSACAECVGRFLLGSFDDPQCMSPSCAKPWIHEFLTCNMTKTFMQGAFKKHREAVLYGRELGYMPATQLEIERDARLADATRRLAEERAALKVLFERRDKLAAHPATVRDIQAGQVLAHFMDMRKKAKTAFSVLKSAKATQKLITNGYRNIKTLKHLIATIRHGDDDAGDTSAIRRAFVRGCPADGCKGFLSTAWKCGLCNIHVCKECHDIIVTVTAGEHACCPESVATAKLLAKDTRTCPTCASLIFKIDGCDQMFCVQCRTAFSWRSGTVVTGAIHNPHYYEWLRSNGAEVPRQPGDVCAEDEVPPAHVINTLMHPLQRSDLAMTFLQMHRMVQHLRYTEMHRYREMRPVDVSANMDVRKRFMQGEIDEQRLKVILQRREKRRRKDHEYHQVLAMLVQVGGELITRFHRDGGGTNAQLHARLIVTLAEFERLRVYANESLRAIGMRYACMHPMIAPVAVKSIASV